MESSRLVKPLWATHDTAKWKKKYEISSVGIFIVRDGE
jgi:DNA-binding PadR family transcriptional regulator